MSEIVVTGVGTVTSIGENTEEVWQGLLTGRSGAKQITSFSVDEHQNKYGCEMERIPPTVLPVDLDGLGRATRIVLPALEEALGDAGLSPEDLAACRTGVSIGTTMGEIEPLEEAMMQKGTAREGGPHVIVENIVRIFGINGPLWTITNACAAGNLATARAMDELISGRADIMIAGGVDAFSWAAFTGFSSLRAMTPELCRPFDINRQGLILGEGAGLMILERADHAEKRSARIRARLLGYAMNCDAHHITQPDPAAQGAARAMEEALKRAGIGKEAIGYVSAHGTGTPANDRMEAEALRTVFGEAAEALPVSSIKGHIGHTLGAASAIEAVACVKALESGVLPPTINLQQQDPACNVQVIANKPLARQVRYMLSNAYAFGGINSSLVLGRAD
ncbi:beta-ketoacyl-[acyl-carrier-protein] synthase family protein [Brevibacillus humidisoli]|uniref:beta-ketoacyl-[acyl-carrier-protein] synthase family protein n=1 Tax=Brevibacillus humidisoli TaxID=2895522 RepID=UPI001E46DB80|nr:beta-ketoacyl-[acyl-carrier-protein] synthase family protein [Brevibacillus humidisoli]UFJ42427.1 beta-ketoacyl-[acyl-carrier-protein] synthase family protein [Brevibacillus humidisoli]